MFTYKALNGLASSYLANVLRPYTPLQSLRSAVQFLLVTPKIQAEAQGGPSLCGCGPQLWNELPLHIKLAPTLPVFKSCLKTHLFSMAFSQTKH